MMSIKIVGKGKVVETLLQKRPDLKNLVKIYTRENLQDLSIKSADHVIYCCSVNEGDYLRKNHLPKKRIHVAKPNLEILKSLLRDGHFYRGKIYILTNPSEILAEYLYRMTKNNHVYALGLSQDQRRYAEITNSEVELGGHHYHHPYLVGFGAKTQTSLRDEFERKVNDEFQNDRPPYLSGAQVLEDLIDSLHNRTQIALSGHDPERGCMGGGILHLLEMKFEPVFGRSALEREDLKLLHDQHRQITKECLEDV